MTQFSAIAQTEEGTKSVSRLRGNSSGTNDIPCTGNWTILKAIRHSTSYPSRVLTDLTADILNTDTGAAAEFAFIINPTINGGSLSYSQPTGSYMETATGNAALYATGGTVLQAGYVGDRATVSLDPDGTIALGFSINGTAQVICLCARTLLGSPNLYAALNWLEI
jgi:hypothetical protein